MDTGTPVFAGIVDYSVTITKRRARVRAPELAGRGWLNTGGKPVSLAELRGRIVLLDFWTFCCINCLHVLDELRPLEAEFSDVLVTIGVHSPKFVHEADPDALAAAVERYEVFHPVLDDPSLTTWQAYAVKAWPTLVLIDPEGYVVHVAAGEGHIESLRRIIRELVAEHEEKGTLGRGSGPYLRIEPPPTELKFPAYVAVTSHNTLLVTDSAHHSLVELEEDGETVLRRIGSGQRGRGDGEPTTATFSEPAGIALLPVDVATKVGYDAVIADTANHLLRGVDLDTGDVTTIAGTGRQWRDGRTDGPALEVDLTSPWGVAWWLPAGGVVFTLAGNHTLGVLDPVAGTVRRFAGTTVEGLKDGAVTEAFFAQPSGLAADGERLWLTDSETSSLRWIEPAGDDFRVRTAVGAGLFAFGHRDGLAEQALLQHPLGLAVLPDGSIAICDTYNSAIRRYQPDTTQVTTLATNVPEPSGAVVLSDELVIVASAAHRLERPVPPGVAAQLVTGEAHQVQRPPSELPPGEVELAVVFTPPPGQKLDDRYGPSTRLDVTSSPQELIIEGAGTSTELIRRLVIADDVAGGVLHVVAQAAGCDDDPNVEHPVCRLTRQDWGIPLRIRASARSRLALMMGGIDDQA